MIRCVRCGTANPETAQYCDECGTPSQQNGNGVVEPEIWRSGRQTMSENEANGIRFEKTQPVAWASEVESELVAGGSPTENAARRDFQTQTATNQTTSVNQSQIPPFGHARIVIERGKNAGKEFVLNDNEAEIGRWDADNGVFPDVDLDADDPEAKVSRRHARIMRSGEQYLIEDVGSTNGTFVNRGRRLLPGNRQILNDNDEIIVGKTFAISSYSLE